MKRQRESMQENAGIGVSITDLPIAILFSIFLRLSIVSIVMCKSVCKAWHGVISDREFVRAHSSQAKVCTLIRDVHRNKISRSFYLFDDEDEYRSGYCSCKLIAQKCKDCRVTTQVKARLKVPLRNAEDVVYRLGNGGDINNDTVFCVGATGKTQNVVKLERNKDRRIKVVNSCNGLLCLYEPGSRDQYIHDNVSNPTVICNPITGEFVHLPNSSFWKHRTVWHKGFGFGFSPVHNEYKMIRVYSRENKIVAEIYTLGSKSWRKTDSGLIREEYLRSPAYLDGYLHWLSFNYTYDRMISFDLNEERFQVHSVPSQACRGSTLTTLGGRLYIFSVNTHVRIWVMNDDGKLKRWVKLFSINYSQLIPFKGGGGGFHHGDIQLVCCNGEAVVMLLRAFSKFVYYDELQGMRFKELKFRGIRSTFEVVGYSPNFIPLEDIVGPDKLEVRSINSGYNFSCAVIFSLLCKCDKRF